MHEPILLAGDVGTEVLPVRRSSRLPFADCFGSRAFDSGDEECDALEECSVDGSGEPVDRRAH